MTNRNGALTRHLSPVIVAIGIGAVLLVGRAGAQDLDPRRYVNLPVAQNFLALGLVHSEGDVNVSPSVPLDDAFLSIKAASWSYIRTMGLGGKATTFDAYVPYACASGSAVHDGERLSRDVCGLGDALVRFTYNFVGAPALGMSDFIRREKELVVGASIQLSVPTGQYDSDYLVNIGANRWVVRPEIGVSIPRRDWSFEFSAGVRIFTDNDDYVSDATFSQDPLFNLQAHVIYDLSPRQWLSLNGNYFFGGAAYNDDVLSAIKQENSRMGLTWFVMVTPGFGLRLAAHTGIATRVGNDSDTFTLAGIYRWE